MRSDSVRFARIRNIAAPILFGVLALLLWQVVVVGFHLKPFIVPSPISIATQFGERFGVILTASVVTATNAFIGLVLGTIVGVIAAGIAAALRVIDEISAPLVTAASVIPIVALAPVLYTMLGASVQTARVLIAALAVFIPVYINTLRGLRSSKPIHRDLMRAYAATPWQVTWAVTLPGALPFFFTGVRIASSLAVISALGAEYFGGPIGGLGKSITSAASSSNYPLAWAFVLGSILTGLVFFCVTLALEIFATRHRSA
jgi:NitT/TauT family transport system permease protein